MFCSKLSFQPSIQRWIEATCAQSRTPIQVGWFSAGNRVAFQPKPGQFPTQPGPQKRSDRTSACLTKDSAHASRRSGAELRKSLRNLRNPRNWKMGWCRWHSQIQTSSNFHPFDHWTESLIEIDRFWTWCNLKLPSQIHMWQWGVNERS